MEESEFEEFAVPLGAVDYAQTRREVLGAWTLGSPLTNFPS